MYPPNPFRYSYGSVTANWVTGIVDGLLVGKRIDVADCETGNSSQLVIVAGAGGAAVDEDSKGPLGKVRNVEDGDLLVRGVLYLMLMSLFSRCLSMASCKRLRPCMKGSIVMGSPVV